MAEEDRTIPFYQNVEGCLFQGGFSSDAIISALKYVPRDDDFFIATFPKCGTTWAQQIVYLIYNKGQPADNYVDFFMRSPFLEMLGAESAERLVRPGAIKTHFPYHLTPYSDKAKYLYVARNPKDLAVSFYHHMITDSVITFQEGTFDSYFEHYISGNTMYNDYFDHVLGWYEHRNDPNVMFLTYEELKLDIRNSVLKIAKFMGDVWFDLLQDTSEIQENVLKYSSFEFMKTFLNTQSLQNLPDSATNDDKLYPGLKHVRNFSAAHRRETDEKFQFVRTGSLGNWRKVLTEDQLSRLDEKIEKKFGGTELYAYWKSIGCI